ncbi:MAG: replication restart helicase PriA [Solirubrobacteraceae bacterium]
MIAKVVPLTRTRAVRGLFDYRIAAGLAPQIEVGSLLRVPFGGRLTLGVVAELADVSTLPPERLAEPAAVLPSRLPADLVELALWMAREYCSTPARGLGLVLPPGTSTGAGPKQALVAELTDQGVAALAQGAPLTPGQREALEALARLGPTVAASLGTPALRRLEARGLVSIARLAQRRRPTRYRIGAGPARAPVLSAEQEGVLEPLLCALGSGRGGRFLLHGVTGSGKTEVYLRAVQATLSAGRQAIVMVPEIALTPQALQRFEARFGDVVAVIHSGLGQGERHDEWQRLARGEARVCVGPRSAVFAPLSSIGLIVVDEEHESSYKHEGDPRYDARTVAERRAGDHRAVLLCGSATPRPESAQSHTRLRMRERVDGRRMPAVEILDMRGVRHPLHPQTLEALAELKRDRGKAILLLNRRGWSNFLSCRSCGEVWMCPNCAVALVLHRHAGYVACHHCGHRERVPERCRACSSVSLARHGAGTERIEHELADALGAPEFPVLRLDADAAGIAARARILAEFAATPAGVLVGTQMVAKGHDFPDVRLGIVLDADGTLRFPDFRAEERTFALVTQLAGRAGRGGSGRERSGRVLVQTLAPDARSIGFAAHHDSDGFLRDELARRRALGYPPFATLIRVVCSSPRPAEATRVASALGERIDPPGASLLGPAPLFALRGRARVQLVIKATQRGLAIASVGAAVDRLAGSRTAAGVSISVDVDPQ